jgi:ribosomal protein L37AE/L43A
MTETAYLIDFYQSEVYHESSDCRQLQGESDLKKMPVDWARESAHLSLCMTCQAAGDVVDVCPECDTTRIYARQKMQPRDRRWKCYTCGETFRQPDTRESQNITDRSSRADSAEVSCDE